MANNSTLHFLKKLETFAFRDSRLSLVISTNTKRRIIRIKMVMLSRLICSGKVSMFQKKSPQKNALVQLMRQTVIH